MTKISFVESVMCSMKGLIRGISNERNVKIQIGLGILAIVSAFILNISKMYLITIIIVSFLVIILELFNTGIEKLIDSISPEYNKKLGEIKDAMAGVVLLGFGLAFLVSILIFYEPLSILLKSLVQNKFFLILVFVNFVLLGIIIILDYKKKHQT